MGGANRSEGGRDAEREEGGVMGARMSEAQLRTRQKRTETAQNDAIMGQDDDTGIRSMTTAKNAILECLRLPWPPSVNHCWETIVIWKNGRKVRGRKKSERALIFAAEAKRLIGNRVPSRELVGVEIRAYFPSRARADLDNLLKILLDSIVQAGVIVDDSQIVDLRIVNAMRVVKGGMVEVSMWEMAA